MRASTKCALPWRLGRATRWSFEMQRAPLRPCAHQAALVHRWSGFLTAAAMQAFAASLSTLPSARTPSSVTCLPTALARSLMCSPAGFQRMPRRPPVRGGVV